MARDGLSVVLGDGGVCRVLRGRPVASGWGVGSVLGSFESSFDCGAGEWMAGVGEVANPLSGWGDGLTLFVGGDGEWVNGRRANVLVVACLVGAGLCAVVVSVPPPLGFSLLCCLVFVALRVPASSRGVRHVRERGGAAPCLRPWRGSALCVCVSGWWLGASRCVRGLACLFARSPVCARGVVLVWGCAPANGVAAIFTR